MYGTRSLAMAVHVEHNGRSASAALAIESSARSSAMRFMSSGLLEMYWVDLPGGGAARVRANSPAP